MPSNGACRRRGLGGWWAYRAMLTYLRNEILGVRGEGEADVLLRGDVARAEHLPLPQCGQIENGDTRSLTSPLSDCSVPLVGANGKGSDPLCPSTAGNKLLHLLVDVEDDQVGSCRVDDALLVKVPYIIGHIAFQSKGELWLGSN